jgi:hypothetical protein
MEEIWKPVVGYEGCYEVSNLGRVNSIKRNGTLGGILKKILDTDGYIICCLMKSDIRMNKKVHRLVAQAFIPNPDNKPAVNHIDNDKTNNKVSNLEWCTNKENSVHCVKQNRQQKGEVHYSSKLKLTDILFIRQSNLLTSQLAKKLNVSWNAVDKARKGKSWKHVL